jgi:hypothetical protein
MMASQEGHLEIVRFLVEKGANVNAASTNDGSTALIMAIRHPKIVEVLAGRGANIDAALTGGEDQGFTALISAVDDDCVRTARLLLKLGANLNIAGANGVTVLLLALENRKLPLARLLIERGADVNAKRTSGDSTALLLALTRLKSPQAQEFGQLLVERGAKVNNACLRWIVENGDVALARILLEGVDNVSGSFLAQAARRGNLEMARLLVSKGASLMKYLASRFQGDPVMLALLQDHQQREEGIPPA